ncbi:MAG TPA: peptidoglycan DD-metalloendopeptidase family protein, partial [Solirubrobacterales bacterium]|nr:peptidoglycan DD-metalloendopeptidase family protein [Solirubrobacterales bacterium]
SLGAPTALSEGKLPACSNGVDDDHDGLTDLADPDCVSPNGESEEPPQAKTETPSPPSPPAEGEGAPGPQSSPSPGSGAHNPVQGPALSPGRKGGVSHNQTIGIGSKGGGRSPVVSAAVIHGPSATGGVQPAPGANGGSSFGSNGAPTRANPTTTIAPFGPARIGVPNFVIDSFEIPPFLLPIYQACGTEYEVPWEVLAAINKIETDFGTNLNVSSAGAVGWMQFLPSSWEQWGVDANGDGRKDPYNPVDAICAAARYLHAAGGSQHLYEAIFAYNHADWYVQEVLLYARAYGRLPSGLVGSLTGLTEGAHFPVAASARYADEISIRAAMRRGGTDTATVSSAPTRRGIDIYSHQGAPVVAVNDGEIKAIGRSRRLGRFIVLEDAYGNRYTYAQLGQIVRRGGGVLDGTVPQQPLVDSQNLRPRLYALPGRAPDHGHRRAEGGAPSLHVGSRVIGGAIIARVGSGSGSSDPHIDFAIRPVGLGAPRIDPKPILDGWKLLEATAIYRARGKSPFARYHLGIGGVLLLPDDALQQRVLHDRGLSIQPCGRRSVAAGRIDRRVLAILEYLSARGFRLGVGSLGCHPTQPTSAHGSSQPNLGSAVDVTSIDGVPVRGHQGPGTLADALIKSVLQLQGALHPSQVVSQENLPGPISVARPHRPGAIQVAYLPTYEAQYVSPFLNASTGRIDQGVDFTGTGPILAVGGARILQTGAPGWPEGGGVLYQLLEGPLAGQVIFVYEGVDTTVKPGETVKAGQQIATFRPGGSIEMGFADIAGVPLSHTEYSEGLETVWGKRMAAFLMGIEGASVLAPSMSSLP